MCRYMECLEKRPHPGGSKVQPVSPCSPGTSSDKGSKRTIKQASMIGHRAFTARCASALLALTMTLSTCISALADEGGVAFWLSGQYAGFAAVPQQPGWYMPTQLYYYNGNAGANKTFQRGNAANLGLNSQAALAFFTPTWVPNEKWFGGQPSFSLTFGGGWNQTSAELSVATSKFGAQSLNRSDSQSGGADLYPQAQIAWTSGVNNWMVYVTGDLPVGSYSSTRLSNIGLGHSAVDVGGAYTYLNNTSGFEASATLGFTYNNENTSTNYQSGVDSHLDWDVSQFLSQNWQVGVVGYVYYQLSGDSGSGDRVGSFKSRVAGVGPEIGYSFTVGGQQWYANLRGYWEFWAQNRLAGQAVFATLSIPLGGGSKKK